MDKIDQLHTFRIGLLSSLATVALLLFSEIILEIMMNTPLYSNIPKDEFTFKIIIFGGLLFAFIIGMIKFGYHKLGF